MRSALYGRPIARRALSGGLQQGRLCRPTLGTLCARPRHFDLFFLCFDQNRFHPTTRFHLPCPFACMFMVCPLAGLRLNVPVLSGRLTANTSTSGKFAGRFCGGLPGARGQVFLANRENPACGDGRSGQRWGKPRPKTARFGGARATIRAVLPDFARIRDESPRSGARNRPRPDGWRGDRNKSAPRRDRCNAPSIPRPRCPPCAAASAHSPAGRTGSGHLAR